MGSTPRHLTRLTAIASAIALAAASVATAPAAAQNVYTGCLSQGTLYDVAIGSSPRNPCIYGALVRWNQRGAKGQRGPRGAKGEDGEAGPRGPQGPRGNPGADLRLRTYTVVADTTGAEGQLLQVAADCDQGDLATGGGFETDGLILASLGTGSPSPTGWQAIAEANDEATSLSVSAICADLPPTR